MIILDVALPLQVVAFENGDPILPRGIEKLALEKDLRISRNKYLFGQQSIVEPLV